MAGSRKLWARGLGLGLLAALPSVAAARMRAAPVVAPEVPADSDDRIAEPAAGRQVQLRWRAPPGCPSADAFIAAVDDLLGHALTVAEGASVAVAADVERSPAGFTLQLSVTRGAAVHARTLSSLRCIDLVEAGSLIVAMDLLDASPTPRRLRPVAVLPRVAQTAEPGEPVPAEPAPASSTASPRAEGAPVVGSPSSPSPRRGRWRVGLAALGGVGVGTQPRAAGVGRLELSLLAPRVRASLVGQHGWPTEATGIGGSAVAVRMVGGGARGCWTPPVGPLSVLVCAGVSAANLRGRGEGSLIDPQTRGTLWLGLPLGVGVAWAPASWIALRAQAEVPIALRRPGFHAGVGTTEELLFRPAPAALWAVAGVEVRLPSAGGARKDRD